MPTLNFFLTHPFTHSLVAKQMTTFNDFCIYYWFAQSRNRSFCRAFVKADKNNVFLSVQSPIHFSAPFFCHIFSVAFRFLASFLIIIQFMLTSIFVWLGLSVFGWGSSLNHAVNWVNVRRTYPVCVFSFSFSGPICRCVCEFLQWVPCITHWLSWCVPINGSI